MARLIKHTATGPAQVKTKSGDSVWICRCGLTTNQDGTCSGAHLKVKEEDPDKLYCYNHKGNRKTVKNDCC